MIWYCMGQTENITKKRPAGRGVLDIDLVQSATNAGRRLRTYMLSAKGAEFRRAATKKPIGSS